MNEELLNTIYTTIYDVGLKLLLALAYYIVGRFIIKRLLKLLKKTFKRTEFDESVEHFLLSTSKVLMYVLLFITIAQQLGAQMMSLVGIISAASLAIGLALQGSLANFAGGVLILILKPFSVGDFIDTSSYAGTVESIQVFYTVLNTPDNIRVVIPNAGLSNSATKNYSANATRRVDLAFGVSYDADNDKVKALLHQLCDDHELILKEPKAAVVLAEHGDSAVIYSVKVWCKNADYWTVYFDMMEAVKLTFDDNQISIPYPHMDVSLTKEA